MIVGELPGENAPTKLVGDLFGEPPKADRRCCHGSSLPEQLPFIRFNESLNSK